MTAKPGYAALPTYRKSPITSQLSAGVILMSMLPVVSVPVAAVTLGLAGWMLASVDTSMPTIDEPGLSVDSGAVAMRLELPTIQPFEAYYGRPDERNAAGEEWYNLNPFLPWQKRLDEQQALEREPVQAEVIPVMQPPPQGRPQPRVPPPTFEPPPIDVSAPSMPEVSGIVAMGGVELLLVRFGDGPSRRMQPGQVIDGWTLIGVEGLVSVWEDADGLEHRIPIGIAAEVDAGSETGSAAVTPTATPSVSMVESAVAQNVNVILDALAEDEAGRRLLNDNPGLEEQLRQNPEQAAELLRRLRQHREGQGR